MLRIGIVNVQEETGKTTAALHLARQLDETGDTAVVLDTDPEGSALAWQRRRQNEEVPPVLEGSRSVEDALQSVEDASVVVIDGASKIEARADEIIRVSHVALIPVPPTPPHDWGVGSLVESVRQAGTPAAFLRVQLKPSPKGSKQSAETPSQAYDLPVFDSQLTYRGNYNEAVFYGRTVQDIDGAKKAKEEVAAVTSELKRFVKRAV